MAATPSIKIVKMSTWRDDSTRLWSNRYHFNGGTPADSGHWTTLADAITAVEKTIYLSGVHIVEAIGYAAGSEVPVFTKSYSLAGTLSSANGNATPGDVASLIRYSTTARTSKNHPIYLFNYYHGALWDGAEGAVDEIDVSQKSAMATYASDWVSGFSDGSITAVRAGPNGTTATGALVEDFLTTRDFRR